MTTHTHSERAEQVITAVVAELPGALSALHKNLRKAGSILTDCLFYI
jgi:hypothetical protein